MQDGDYLKARDTANATLAVIKCSNLQAVDFDEALLDNLKVLATTIDADTREGGGSILCVQAEELLYQRHLGRGRHVEGAKGCQEVVRLASQNRFKDIAYVQTASSNAMLMLSNLQFFGLVTLEVAQ